MISIINGNDRYFEPCEQNKYNGHLFNGCEKVKQIMILKKDGSKKVLTRL